MGIIRRIPNLNNITGVWMFLYASFPDVLYVPAPEEYNSYVRLDVAITSLLRP